MVRLSRCVLAVASGLFCAIPARAVILYSSENRNETPSADSIAYPAWQLEGQFGSFLGTPIAPNYFITAAHIGTPAGPLVYQGSSYAIDPSFGTGGRTILPGSDLAVWKITGTFQTYAPLYTGSDETDQHIVVIGRGTQRGSEVLVREQLRGWLWGPADGKQSWGENDVTRIIDAGEQLGDMLEFDFDGDRSPNECSLSSGDSGGAVFIQDAGVWKLAGINYSVSGPFSYSRLGTDPFLAALFDLRGLFVQTDVNAWSPGYGTGASYASRISPHASSIYSLVPGCPVVQADYSVTGLADMGTVDVAGTTTVGNGVNSATLKATYIRGNTLSIQAGSRVVVNPNGTDSGTSRLSNLNIASDGQLDLTNNALIIQADSSTRQAMFNQVSELIARGRNGGRDPWQGNGITSSTAAESFLKGLAIILNDDGTGIPIYTSFGGQGVDANSILVKYTWNGDLDLNGKVDGDDYFLIDSGFLTRSRGYRNGDINYDGVIDGDDYFLMDSAFLGQNAPSSLLSPGGGTLVPEPTTLGMLGLIGLGFLIRRTIR
ncbi:MAG: PEP-CTERM sorting domain-containing protein [Bacillota bacterium]